MIGNPPYTRVQVLNRHRPEEARLYEQHFTTAEASYDIATLFVERSEPSGRRRRKPMWAPGGS